jgi:hypothetical protein
MLSKSDFIEEEGSLVQDRQSNLISDFPPQLHQVLLRWNSVVEVNDNKTTNFFFEHLVN